MTNWISVNDAMPPAEEEWPGYFRSVDVLAAAADGVCVGYVTDCSDEDEPARPGWQQQGRDAYRLDGVTHWMLLPAPPAG